MGLRCYVPMPMAISIDDWLLAIWPWLLVIGYGYWLMAMCIEYWLLAIGYCYWLLAIIHRLWLLAIHIYTKTIVAMVITHFGYWPLSMAMLIIHWLLAIVHWLVVLAIDIYTRAIMGIIITNWLLPIVHGYALNPLAIGYWPL